MLAEQILLLKSTNQLELPHFSAFGWTKSGEMIWIEMAFPEHIEDLFMEMDNSEDEDAKDVLGMDDGTDEDD